MKYNRNNQPDYSDGQLKVYVRGDQPLTKCKRCGEDIWWRTTPKGKYQPISHLSGICHIEECIKAKE